jgi:aminoglycoside phosphotransferase (APT) family kinase protein
MTTSGEIRDLVALRAGLEAWCEHHRPDVVAAGGIEELRHATAGKSNETIVVRCRPLADGSPGPSFVLRPPPVVPSFPDIDFALQAEVQNVVTRFGVPTASPVVVERDPSWIGVPFIVMPFVDGYIVGDAPIFDPWMKEATEGERRESQRELVRVLASIHAIDWREAGLDRLLVGGTGSLDAHLEWWRDYLVWAHDGVSLPRVDAILAWCRDHRPDEVEPPALLWGDPRLGNLVMAPDRNTRAVLDWDLATIGPAEMDLGWWLAHERLLHELVGREPLAGLADADEVAYDYEAATGRQVQDLGWHMIFAVFRSTAVTIRQAAIAADADADYLVPGGEDNPMIAITEKWIASYPGSSCG